ncbi:hypothetical protein PIB30_099617 [Stylosanthes scabra]|uniref:Uncharacterized protein n=1 Tax=Stylosanthes scabra TaxID=79078 RepID=A0ABU6WWU4_9FABA|nr:hypothetical protein [Stylosanthes scabra]
MTSNPLLRRMEKLLMNLGKGGSLRTKTIEEALDLIELVATNQYMNFSGRNTMKKDVMEVDFVNALMAQLSAMSKKLEKLATSAVGTQIACGLCGGP